MRDSHPHWCSFPRGLHLRLRWQYISRLQFKARSPDFHAELVPVHSPLLRESYLVSFPPLTYMLKFSGFADLTSCLEVVREHSEHSHPHQTSNKGCVCNAWFVADRWRRALSCMRQGQRSALTHKHTKPAISHT